MEKLNEALASLATSDLAQLRLSGLILAVLKDRGFLDQHQAVGVIDEAASQLPADHPMLPGFAALKREFLA